MIRDERVNWRKEGERVSMVGLADDDDNVWEQKEIVKRGGGMRRHEEGTRKARGG